ncbi:MAG: ribonuclease P protein component [Planctomycetes bacterium]|nr:ribonuclease P protein component [Planctomycetota bacterium]
MPKPLSYPRHLRLVHKKDFERVYREGLRARGATMLVVGAENGLPHARLGLSVGRTIWKSAVARNRVRRIFRESFRLSQHDLPPGLDLILIPGRPKLEPELAATCVELIELAGKIARKEARPQKPRDAHDRGGKQRQAHRPREPRAAKEEPRT